MKYLFIGWLVLFGAGCSVANKQPILHDFGRIGAVPVHQGDVSININAPTWLWDNRIRYRLLFASPSEVSFYGLDRWIASPPELFEQLLASNAGFSGYSLIIRLQDFEQQFDAPDKARVVLRFTVEAYSPGDKQKLGLKEFYLEQPAKTPDAAGAINGFADLTHQAGKQIQGWVLVLSGRREKEK
jgi:cholesterol transport system auxiliary component